MTLKKNAKAYALKHQAILKIWRGTFGKIKTKWYFDHQRKRLQKIGIPMIKKIDQVLTDAGAQYFVDCGTLLGIIRDKKPIEYDRDIDFGIWFDEQFTPERLQNIMKEIGLKLIRRGIFQGKVQELTFSSGSVHIDFFPHTEIGNESWLYVFYIDPNRKYPTKNHCSMIVQKRLHITGLKRIACGGIEMNIPENVEDYLASAYTKNWLVPDPNWRYTMEPGCTYLDEFGIREKG